MVIIIKLYLISSNNGDYIIELNQYHFYGNLNIIEI
jgi:hypothetical protein